MNEFIYIINYISNTNSGNLFEDEYLIDITQ